MKTKHALQRLMKYHIKTTSLFLYFMCYNVMFYVYEKKNIDEFRGYSSLHIILLYIIS